MVGGNVSASTTLAEKISIGDTFRYHGEVVECIGEHRRAKKMFELLWFKFRVRVMAGEGKGVHCDVIFGPGDEVELVTWVAQDAELRHEDEIGGDAAGLSWSACWERRVPSGGYARVVRHWYVVDTADERYTRQKRNGRWIVESATEWATYTNPSDPGMTETWSDLGYDDPHHDLVFPTEEAAERAAREYAEYDRQTFAVDYPWEGEATP